MNQYADTTNQQAILKNAYDGTSALGQALRKRRLKLAETKGVELNSSLNKEEDKQDES